MALSRSAVTEIAVAICFLYAVLQIVALGRLTGERRMTGMKYLVVAVVAAFFLLDLLLHASGWAVVEGFVLIVTVPFAVAHLTILLVQESLQS